MKNMNAKEVRAIPKRRACPLCGHKELLTEGPDQFCLSCDWDTCAEYVERGFMNNLDLAYREHFSEMPAQGMEMGQEQHESVFTETAPVEPKQQIFERIA